MVTACCGRDGPRPDPGDAAAAAAVDDGEMLGQDERKQTRTGRGAVLAEACDYDLAVVDEQPARWPSSVRSPYPRCAQWTKTRPYMKAAATAWPAPCGLRWEQCRAQHGDPEQGRLGQTAAGRSGDLDFLRSAVGPSPSG